MSKRRSAVLAMGLCAALGVTVWTAAATVPLGAVAPGPPADSAAATVPPGQPRGGSARGHRDGRAGRRAPGPTQQAPSAGQRATVVQPLIFMELTRPAGGRSEFRGREGELMLFTLPDVGSVGFVPRIRDDAQQVVTFTVFELDNVPHPRMRSPSMSVSTWTACPIASWVQSTLRSVESRSPSRHRCRSRSRFRESAWSPHRRRRRRLGFGRSAFASGSTLSSSRLFSCGGPAWNGAWRHWNSCSKRLQTCPACWNATKRRRLNRCNSLPSCKNSSPSCRNGSSS